MKWKIRESSYDDVERLQEKFKINSLLSRVLSARKITDSKDISFFLEDNISFLHNPFLFKDMQAFCDRVLQAVEKKEKVRVFGDRDADGVTSTALMYLELKSMGLDVSWTVPEGDEPYGVNIDLIDRAVADNVSLGITVDCGISCAEEVEYAEKKHLDFLITDHHLSDSDVLPPAVALIDPKVKDCGYPFDGLAGCGVVAKCIWALRFAQTERYKKPYILLHAFPGNSTVIIEACKVVNMLRTETVAEEVVPGALPASESRVLKYLRGEIEKNITVYVLDSETETKQIQKAFPGVELSFTDLRSKFNKKLVYTRGKSLYQLVSESRFVKYDPVRSELTVLENLFYAYIRISLPQLYEDYKGIMDFVAIGTVSDLMPLLDENRILVKAGLKQLEKIPRMSLLPFFNLQNLSGSKLTTKDIGWKVSPQLNAAGRMGKPSVAVNMLVSSEREKALFFAQELLELNKKRQKVGQDAWKHILPLAQKSYKEFDCKIIVVKDKTIPRGFTGPIATRLQKTFNCPVIVISVQDSQKSLCNGSVRSPESFNCYDFLSRYASLFVVFGGHACAGGFTIESDKIDELCISISEDSDYLQIKEDVEKEVVLIDSVVSENEMTEHCLSSVADMIEPCGEHNPPVHFLAEGVTLRRVTKMQNTHDPSNSHIKFTMEYGRYSWPCVFWEAGQRVGVDFDDDCLADVVFTLARNNFNGQQLLQLNVIDLKKHVL